MSKQPLIFPETKDALNEIKRHICRAIRYQIYLERKSYRQIAFKLQTSESNICRVMNERVDDLTFNQLFRYLVVLAPKCQVLISPV
jgi:hypothetical protein